MKKARKRRLKFEAEVMREIRDAHKDRIPRYHLAARTDHKPRLVRHPRKVKTQ